MPGGLQVIEEDNEGASPRGSEAHDPSSRKGPSREGTQAISERASGKDDNKIGSFRPDILSQSSKGSAQYQSKSAPGSPTTPADSMESRLLAKRGQRSAISPDKTLLEPAKGGC